MAGLDLFSVQILLFLRGTSSSCSENRGLLTDSCCSDWEPRLAWGLRRSVAHPQLRPPSLDPIGWRLCNLGPLALGSGPRSCCNLIVQSAGRCGKFKFPSLSSLPSSDITRPPGTGHLRSRYNVGTPPPQTSAAPHFPPARSFSFRLYITHPPAQTMGDQKGRLGRGQGKRQSPLPRASPTKRLTGS